MEIKIHRSEFIKGLGIVQSIAERKTTTQILTNLLLSARGKTLTITATDLEVGLKGEYTADIIADGNIAVHAKSIYDIVRELPNDIIHLKIVSGNWIEINCKKSSFKIAGTQPDEFPAIPTKGDGDSIKIDAATLNSVVVKNSFAMSNDEGRPNLNGVLLEYIGDETKKAIRFVSTDGHRISIVERDIASDWHFQKSIIIPKKGVMELKKMAEAGDEPIEMWMDQRNMMCTRGGVTLVVRLLDGKYPPYEQVLPRGGKHIVSLDRQEFIKSLRRVSVLLNDDIRGVKFSVSPNNLDIVSSSPDFGEAREEMNIAYKGESFDVAFNAKYFIEVLSIIEDEKAVLQMGDDTAPCIIKSEFDRGFTHVIMPMRL